MTKESILIIGASSDLGIDLIKSMTEDCVILAHYHNSHQELERLANEGRHNQSQEIELLQADLSDETAVMNMLQEIEERFGTPSKIVHLAATRVQNIRFKDVQWQDFENDLLVSLKSLVLILQRILPKLAKEKRGKVVVMLSSYVMGIPPKALAHYTTVKYALLGLVKSLASEYREKNIQINAISPSMIDTKFLSNINEKLVELNAYHHPLKRNAQVSDVTPIIKLLLSPESDYMNGCNIPITGGSSF